MIEVFIKNMCLTIPDANKYAEGLDRAARSFNGYRDIVLEEKSNWDTWYFPEEIGLLVTLFVDDPKYLCCEKKKEYV